jgi:aminoglycoside phosphotransferase (APT) family kinase protein
VDTWRDQYPDSRLTYQDSGDRIVLVNTRRDYDWEVAELTDPVDLALFRLLSQPRSATTLAACTPGGEARVTPLVERWTAMGLLFHDSGSCLHVAVEANNQVLMRMKRRHSHFETETSTEDKRDAVSLP